MLAMSTSSSSVHRRIDSSSEQRRCRCGRVQARRRRARSRGSAGAGRPAAPTAAGTGPAPGSTSLRRVCTPVAAVEHPGRQRRLAQRLAGVDVVLDPLRHLLPAGLLPQLERALLDAEAPAHREVDVARAVGDRARGARPRSGSCCAGSPTGTAPAGCWIRAAASAARRRASSACARRSASALPPAGHVVALGRVEAQDVLAHLLVEAGAGLLAQRAGCQQLASTAGVAKLA